VKSRTTTIIGTLALAICLVCPIVDAFDYWDHAPQTGTDTEYTFVIIGLCVGALYTFAHAVLKMNESSQSKSDAATDDFLPAFIYHLLDPVLNSFIVASPPLTALRI
jgi:hypothetical protein